MLAETLLYDGITFYFIANDCNTGDRVYASLDELHHKYIVTAPGDYDGVLIGSVDECFREDEDDDMIRHFHWQTGLQVFA